MARTIGVVLTDRLVVGIVEDNRVVGDVTRYPEGADEYDGFQGMPAEAITHALCDHIMAVLDDTGVTAVGVGMPGIIRNGVIEESPNLHQLKGLNIQQSLLASLRERGKNVQVQISNDADVIAAGLAATKGQLDRLVRVWTLGTGIGFGHYPANDGVWEGGHTVVTLESKESYCGCGGIGHLEGIMGHRAMRLRFLALEPDEVFAAAKSGDPRCVDFVKLWHRALAAATANSIHMDGPGKFYFTGSDAHHLDLSLLHSYVQEMVKMSPLQGYVFEVVTGGEQIAIIGAAVAAQRAAA